jgi:hypothetical protein
MAEIALCWRDRSQPNKGKVGENDQETVDFSDLTSSGWAGPRETHFAMSKGNKALIGWQYS